MRCRSSFDRPLILPVRDAARRGIVLSLTAAVIWQTQTD